MAKRRNKQLETEQPEVSVSETQPETVEQLEVKKEELPLEVSVSETPPETVEQLEVKRPEVKKETSTSSIPKTIEDVYSKYKNNAVTGMLVEAIMHYLSVIFGPRGNDGKTVASQNYNFYKLLLNVLSEKDYGTFKVKFDAINEMFCAGKNDKFNPVSLSKFDHYWSYGGESRMKYLLLVEFIATMSNPAERAKAKKRFNINNVTKSVPQDAVQNLVRYYKL